MRAAFTKRGFTSEASTARALGVKQATFNRWMRGENTPRGALPQKRPPRRGF